MSTLNIEWVEEKTSAKGTKYKRATVNDSGRVINEVAVFSSFSQYENVAAGRTVEGIVKIKMYQGKESYSLEDIITQKTFAAKPNAINKAMEVKAQNIQHAQENKQEGIKVSGAQRDATLWITTFFNNEQWTQEELREKWVEMKNFFMNQFDQAF